MQPPPTDIEQIWLILQERLRQAGYQHHYIDEMEFEADVWKRVRAVAAGLRLDISDCCLTSHKVHPERSVTAWNRFLNEQVGPDVEALGANNRLDIVFRHPSCGSIGIEVKCLGPEGHAGKLTQSLGQALLGLWHRDRTIVAIHCGTVGERERDRLRRIGEKICQGTKVALVVVP